MVDIIVVVVIVIVKVVVVDTSCTKGVFAQLRVLLLQVDVDIPVFCCHRCCRFFNGI